MHHHAHQRICRRGCLRAQAQTGLRVLRDRLWAVRVVSRSRRAGAAIEGRAFLALRGQRSGQLAASPRRSRTDQSGAAIAGPASRMAQILPRIFRRIVSPIEGLLVALVAVTACGAGAQDLDLAVSGFAVAPPAGYVATPVAPASPSRVVLRLAKPDEPGVSCEASFEALPGFEHFSQEMLNRQTDNPDWEAFYRDGLGDFYAIATVAR